MGQVLGFSHCQEYGSVASTPDSTPPCTDGGNEESEVFDLQTAREWSEDEMGDDGDPDDDDDDDDDDGLASSPSVWGTPRQNSYELTFSYFAIAEAEAAGASRHLRDRRRGGPRQSRTPLIRTDTLETLLDSPDVDWDPHAFLNEEEDNERSQEGERTAAVAERTVEDLDRQTQTITIQPSPQSQDPDSQEAGTQSQETESMIIQTLQTLQTPPPSPVSQQQTPTQLLQASLTPDPEFPAVRETISVTLLTSAQPRAAASSTSADTDVNPQERLVSDQWYSALNLSEEPAVCTHRAVMDLIYWKETEKTGMVLTGLVIGLLTLFQLSIITVLSTASLAVVCVTTCVRVYYQVLHALKWGHGEHPFKTYLEMDISFSGEQAQKYTRRAIVLTASAVDSLKRLFFVANLFDSLKFLVLLYLMTFLGALCNGLTIFIICVIAVFSLPLFYRQRQEQVDSVIAKIQAQFDNVKDIVERLARGGGPPPDLTPGGAKPQSQ